jgi:hypothetical protein
VLVSSSRRSLLKKGVFGGAVLFLGSAAASLPILWRPHGRLRAPGQGATPAPSRPLRYLSPIEYGVFAALSARLVLGDDAPAGWPSTDRIDCAGRLDELLGTLHPRAARELCRLLRIFENGMTGLLATGHPETFSAAAPLEQDRRLEAWRHSRLAVLRSGYEALKRLAHATYYSAPEVFASVGYAGPPGISAPVPHLGDSGDSDAVGQAAARGPQ